MITAATEPADPHTVTASPRTQPPAKSAAPTSFSNAATSTRPSRSPKLMPTRIPDDLAATKGTLWASPASTNGYTSKPVTRVTAPTPAPSPSNTADAPKVSTVALTPSSSSSPPITPTTPSVRLAEECSLPSPTSPPPTESLPSALQSSRQLTSVKNTTKSRSRKKTSLKRNPSPAISATHSTPTIHSTTAVIPSSPTTSHCSTTLPTKGQHSTDRLENDTPAPLLRPTARLGHLRTSPPLTHPKESVPESSHLARSTAPVAELAVNSQPLSEELFAHCQPIHRPKAVGRRSSSSLMSSSTTTGRSSPSHKMVTRSLEPSPELRARLSTATTSPRIRPLDPLPKASAASLHSICSSDASQACRRPVSTAKWFSPFDPHWQVSLDFLRSERQRQSRCRPPPGFPATPAGTTRPPPHSLTQHRPASMMWDGFNAISTRHQRSASEQTSIPRPPPGLTNFGPGQDMPSSNVLPLRTSLDQSLLTTSQSVLLQEEATANLLPRGPSPVGFGLTSSLAMPTPPLRYNLSFDGCLATVNDHRRPFTANAGGVVGYGTGNKE
ncbi:hypothetical protein H4R35_002601 [Dimargaris xerosporica]|nr:hypothetical protein H4R35_002601 [Dimargaris xerosporica]